MFEESGAIQPDATNNSSGLTDEQAEQAFLDRWSKDAEEPSETASPGEREPEEEDFASQEHESGDTDQEENEVSEDAEDTEEAKPASRTAGDDDEVEVKVGEENLKLSVKDLKRLAGQEYALNKKSMEVSEQRKTADLMKSYYEKKVGRDLERAERRWKEYEGLDMNLAAADLATGKLSEDQYRAVKAERDEREADVMTARKEYSEALKVAEAERNHAEQQRVQAAIKAIHEKHGDVRELAVKLEAYADGKGLTKEEQFRFLHPVLFDMMNKARLYDEAKAKQPELKKVVAQPARVLKPQSTSQKQPNSEDAAKRRLRSTGDDDAAIALLMARRAKRT